MSSSSLYDYLALTLDVAVTAYLLKLHWKECATINNIKRAPRADVGKDLSILMKSQYPNRELPYAIVRGCVTDVEGNTVESSTGIKGVIQITTVHEITARRFGDSWDVDSMPPLSQNRNSVPFALKSMSTNSSTSSDLLVAVEKPFDSIWENLLLPTSSHFTPSNSSVNSAVMGAVGKSKVLGIRKTEKFLPIGTIVTGIGKIAIDERKGYLKLQGPVGEDDFPYVLTTLSVEDLINKLELRRNIQRVIIGMTLSIGMIIIGRRLYKIWKSYKLKLLRNQLLRERINVNLDDLCRCQTCLVCLVNPREIIILNCGHVCVCADCILKLNGLCPVCRHPISASHKAYIV